MLPIDSNIKISEVQVIIRGDFAGELLVFVERSAKSRGFFRGDPVRSLRDLPQRTPAPGLFPGLWGPGSGGNPFFLGKSRCGVVSCTGHRAAAYS